MEIQKVPYFIRLDATNRAPSETRKQDNESKHELGLRDYATCLLKHGNLSMESPCLLLDLTNWEMPFWARSVKPNFGELIIPTVGHAAQRKQNFTDGSQMLKNHTNGQHF